MRMPPATRKGSSGSSSKGTGGAASSSTTTPEERFDDPWKVHSSWSRASPRKKTLKQDTRAVAPASSPVLSGRKKKVPTVWSSDGWTTTTTGADDDVMSSEAHHNNVSGWPTATVEQKNNAWGTAVDLQTKLSDDQQWNAGVPLSSGSNDDDEEEEEDEAWKINRIVSVPAPSPPLQRNSPSPRIGSIERPIPVLQQPAEPRMEGSTTPTHRNHHHNFSSSSDYVTRLRQEHDDDQKKNWQQQREEDRERDVLERAAEKRANTPTHHHHHTANPSSGGSGGGVGRRFARRQQQHEVLLNSDDDDDHNNMDANGKQRKGLLRFFGGGRKKKAAHDSSVSELSEGTGISEPPQPVRYLHHPPPSEKHHVVAQAPQQQRRSVVDRWNNRKSASSSPPDATLNEGLAAAGVTNKAQPNEERNAFPVQNILGDDKINKAVVPRNGSNEESTVVSEVTNPTFFQENRRSRLMVDSSNHPLGNNNSQHALDPFDVNSPIFSTGDPFGSKKQQQQQQETPSPRKDAFVTQAKSDEFSDPFFPSRENAIKEGLPAAMHHVQVVNRLEVDVAYKEEKKEDEGPDLLIVKPSAIRKQGEWLQPSTSSGRPSPSPSSSLHYSRANARRVIEKSKSSTPTNELRKVVSPAAASPKKSPIPTARARSSPKSSPVISRAKASPRSSPVTTRAKASPKSSPVTARAKASPRSSPVNTRAKASPRSSPVTTRAMAFPTSPPVTARAVVPSPRKSPISSGQRSSVFPKTSPVPVSSAAETLQNGASAKYTDRLKERRRRSSSVPKERPGAETVEPEPPSQQKSASAKHAAEQVTISRGYSVRDRITTAYREGKYRAPSPNSTTLPAAAVQSPPPPPPPPPPLASTKRTKDRSKPKKLELVRSTDDDAQPTPKIPKYAETSAIATTTKKADTYAYVQKRISTNGDSRNAPPKGKTLEVVRSVSEDENSLTNKSSDSNSLSSVGSDLRRLRSILRRSRTAPVPPPAPVAQTMGSTFSVYSEHSNDPMQRAGLRLLSAAVIPIQCLVRRHLSLREALTRMWALVIIQSCVRRWIVMHRLRQEHAAATKIQAVSRGGIEREKLVLEHCCAIEIQRHVRALLATIHVYEMLYKVTKIQAFARRCLAVNEAMDRMVSVIQAQSAARRFLARSQLARENIAATRIQACYRSHSARLDYKLNLLDIVIVQSVWRRRSAMLVADHYRQIQRNNAAVLIQTQWRSYDCTMNYWHFLADVLISQSAVRRWLARRKVRALRYTYARKVQTAVRVYLARQILRRERAAVKMQKTWRGYVWHTIVRQEMASIKMQKAWRGHVGRFKAREKRQENNASIAIQKTWRCFLCRRAYQEALEAIAREISAICIQKAWRGFVCHRSYTTELDSMKRDASATCIQKNWRGFLCFKAYQAELEAIDREISAIYIQKTWRGYVCFRAYQEELAVIDREISAIFIQKTWRGYSCFKAYQNELAALEAQFAAIHIQKTWRGLVAYRSYHEELAAKMRVLSAVTVQKVWRARTARKILERERAATKIQKVWRGYLWYMLVREELAAIMIQKTWRSFVSYKTVCVKRKHRNAAIVIQKSWRGFVSYADYMFTLADIVIVQSLVRKQKARKEVTRLRHEELCNSSAVLIQSLARGCNTRKTYSIFKSVRRGSAARVIQRVARQAHLKNITAATIIQSYWRRLIAESELFILKVEHGSAAKIQSAWRRFWCFSNFIIALDSAITIQAAFRGYSTRNNLVNTMSATILIQTVSRDFLSKRRVRIEKTTDAVDTLAKSRSKDETDGSVNIQAAARGYLARSVVTMHTKARKIQRTWRAIKVRRSFLETVAARKMQSKCSAITIQAAFRGYSARNNLVNTVSATILIQSVSRDFLLKRRVRIEKTTDAVNTLAKSCSKYETDGSVCIQAAARGYLARSVVTMHMRARKIQSKWRAYLVRRSFLETVSARKIQSEWRGYIVRTAVIMYLKARKIQSMWRRFWIRRSFVETLSARKIQSQWRGYLVRTAVMMHLEARKIQSVWRCYSIRASYLEFLAVRTIQSAWRGCSVRMSYVEFLAARQIQKTWRRYSVRASYREYTGARKIQTVYRGYVVQNAYKSFMAARKIQTAWRCYAAYTSFTKYLAAYEIQRLWQSASSRQALVEYRSACTIAAAWRRKKTRKFFVRLRARVMAKTIRSAVVAQRVFRGYRVRRTQPSFTTWLLKLSKTYRAATAIQRCFRGYHARMAYWQILGSTIQIQTLVRVWQAKESLKRLAAQASKKLRAIVRIQSAFRRWLAQTDFLAVAGAAIIVQMIARGYLARKEYKQRRFISLLCESASVATAERQRGGSRSVVSVSNRRRTNSDLSDWETVIARQREVEHAARKIQRFFLLVKAEVDREIRMEKKRRRARKKHKKSKAKTPVGDDLLEHVWRRTIDAQAFDGARDSEIRHAERAAARELRKCKSSSSHRERSSSRQRNSDVTPRAGPASQRSNSVSRRRNVLPPEYRSASPLLLVRIHDSSAAKEEDRISEVSGGKPRLPPSRLATLSRSEMDDDFDLEEAWIDAGINNARARRLAEKDSKRSKKSSSSCSRKSTGHSKAHGSSGRARDGRDMSGRPPNYRTCEM